MKKHTTLSASIGSTDFHHLQKDYDEIKKLNLKTWNEVAWIGDELNSKIVLWTSSSPANNVTLSSSDFISEKGDLISSDNIKISWLKETLASLGRSNPSSPVEPFPDIIHNSTPLNIEENKVASAWIKIKIPRDAKAGFYTGSIKVKSEELEEPLIFNYSFELLNLVQPLPRETTTQIEFWQHPYTIGRYYGLSEKDLFTEKHFKYLKENLKEYKDLGGRAVIATIVHEAWNHQSYDSDPSMIKWRKNSHGTFEFDYSHFDKWIQFNIDLGILDPKNNFGQIKCYSIVPWNNRIQYFNEATNKEESINPSPGSSLWIDTWTQFLTSFMAHLEEKGWFNITYISLDERGMEDLRASVDLIHSIKNKSYEHFKISSAMDYESGNDYSFLDRIDDISIGLSHINHNLKDMRNMATHRQKLNLLTTIYTCTGDYPSSFTISDPSEGAFTMWYSLYQNTNGFLRWSWDGWVENPLENVSYKYWESGDPFLIYPAEKDSLDKSFYSTPRLEKLKEGIRDINKAKYLIEKAPSLKNPIENLIYSLKRPNKGENPYGSAVAASKEDRLLTSLEVKRMKNGINNFAKEFIKVLNRS